MGQVQCLRIRIREGMTGRVVESLEDLSDRRDEVQASLAREGIRAEALFLERGEEADHLVFVIWADDLEAASRAFEESTAPLDRETRRWIEETWEEATPLEPLADFARTDGR